MIGFLFGWTQGKPLLEIPVPLDFLIVVAALLFVANVAMTIILGLALVFGTAGAYLLLTVRT